MQKRFVLLCFLGFGFFGVLIGVLASLVALHHSQFTANHLMDLSFTLLACGALVWIGATFNGSKKEGGHIVAVALITSVMVLLLGGVIYNPSLHSLPITRVKIKDSEITFSKHPTSILNNQEALITSLQRLKHQKVALLHKMSRDLSPCCKQNVEQSIGQLLLLDELALSAIEQRAHPR